MSPMQFRAARALLDWTQPDLAKAAGVGLSTVVDYELQKRKVSDESVSAMRKALEDAGIHFTNGRNPGVKLVRG